MTRAPALASFCVFLLCAVLMGCGGWGVWADGADRRTPLERAAQSGDAAEVRRLLASGADPNGESAFGSPLVEAAALTENTAVIRALIAAGAQPNGRGRQGRNCWTSPLVVAVSSDHLENARALFNAGADWRAPGCSELVVGWLKPTAIELLVQHGLDLLAVDERGRNALHIALAPPVSPPSEGIEYLLRAGVQLNARDRAGKTPLAYWREPRDFEKRGFRMWFFETLTGDDWLRSEREQRAALSASLARAGAQL